MPSGIYQHRPLSKLTKERIGIAVSKALIGRKRTIQERVAISKGHIGLKHSEETKLKIKLKKRNLNKLPKRDHTGFKYKDWRMSIMRRDNYTCQDCKKRGGKLHAHHIKSWKNFPEYRYDIDNGVLLCVACHVSRHKGAGK